MRVYFTNLGCKLNQAELEHLARRFTAAGHQVVASVEAADVQVINSCTVTHLAARTSRKTVRQGRRKNPGLRTVLTGCYASDPDGQAAALEEVDLLVPNDQKDRLLELVEESFVPTSEETVPELPGAVSEEPPSLPFGPLEFGNSRGLVKVEDGCNMRCSFCIIPFTRGRQHSRSVEECVAEVGGLGRAGYQEVVITGVQISAYRAGGARLADLVEALLEQTSVPRLRLTSIAPWQLDPRLLELWQDPRLCRHLHMSLQSGCSATLRRMRRPYTADGYAEVLASARRAVPGLGVTTDVIVGFPGETESEFEDSLAFTQAQDFAKVHVFPYSQRRGTTADALPGQVSPQAKKRRVARMLEVAEASHETFRRRHLGRREEVVWEGRRNGWWRGMTDNYIRVFARSARRVPSGPTVTELLELREDGVEGVPCAG